MDAGAGPTRPIHPWLAALLTVFGWGLGFYHAARTREALLWATAGIVAPITLVVTVLIFSEHWGSGRAAMAMVRWLPWVATALVAARAWAVAARTPSAAQGAPTRPWGYVAIWLVPILAVLLIRFVVVQPFRNPSGAMQPTIQVGEYMIVTKWSYGYSSYSFAPLDLPLPEGRLFAAQPQRGDLVVFRPPAEPDRDFIKRLIGLPGDRVQMIDGALHINGLAVGRESLGRVDFRNEDGGDERIQAYRETLPNGASYIIFDRGETELDTTREYVVPEGHYFMLGDDRDNSADSRVPGIIGYVPYENLVGRVSAILGVPDQRLEGGRSAR